MDFWYRVGLGMYWFRIFFYVYVELFMGPNAVKRAILFGVSLAASSCLLVIVAILEAIPLAAVTAALAVLAAATRPAVF